MKGRTMTLLLFTKLKKQKADLKKQDEAAQREKQQ